MQTSRSAQGIVLLLASVALTSVSAQSGAAPTPVPQNSACRLVVTGSAAPGATIALDLSGTFPGAPLWVGLSRSHAWSSYDLGAGGAFVTELGAPVLFLEAGASDAAGSAGLLVGVNPLLSPDYLQGSPLYLQVLAFEAASGPGSGWRFSVSDPACLKDEHHLAPMWAALKAAAMSRIVVAPGWGPPELLPGPVNSLGWEDSACVAPDGSGLWLSYIPCDYFRWLVADGGSLPRFNLHRRGPPRGVSPEFSFDTFFAAWNGSGFDAPARAGISANTVPPFLSETGAAPGGGSLYYSTNFPASAADADTDIYRNGIRLAINSPASENDPTCAAGTLLFWSDDRPGCAGRRRIFLTHEDWGPTDPVAAPSPVNLPGSDSWQPHLSAAGRLYFVSDRTGHLSIYSSPRLGWNVWGAAAPAIWILPGGAVAGVAEPSTTADGNQLYFCVLFHDGQGNYDLDIARTTRTAP